MDRGLSASLGLLLFCAATASSSEIDTLTARLVGVWSLEEASSAVSDLSSQKSDGTWPDIDYTNRDRTNWIVASHLYRLRSMATAFNQPTHPAYGSVAMKNGVLKGLDAWFAKSPSSQNWFWNDIGPQNQLAPILLIMKPYLTAQQLKNGAEIFKYKSGWTGQNKIWFAAQLVYRGSLTNSPSDVQEGVTIVASEIQVSTQEGMQPEFSFHQHGPMPYNANYGFSLLLTVSPLMHATHGLSFAFPQAKQDILIRYVLEGTQWLFRRGDWALAVHGREISRPGASTTMVLYGADKALQGALQQLRRVAGNRGGEIEAFLNHIKGGNDGALEGNKHFWRSDIMSHRRSPFTASLRMTSTTTGRTESINSENLKGGYFPFGSLFLQRRGDEYRDIRPVWDWSRIPGVTSPHKNATPNGTVQGNTLFVGGVSDGQYGVAAMDLNHDGVTGHKSWFFFDREIVALGSDIVGTGNDPVFTSVNQTAARGEAWTGSFAGNGSALGAQPAQLSGKAWVHHDSTGYLFWDAEAVTVQNAKQTGSWSLINANYSSTKETRDVVSLWFNHGVKPNKKSYAYALLPGFSREEVKVYSASPKVEVVSNTAALQAVRNNDAGITGIAFFAAGTVDVNSDMRIRVSAPCLALAKFQAGKVELTLSNPKKTALSVKADLLSGTQTVASLTFALPGDAANGGKSTTQTFAYTVSALSPYPSAAPWLNQNHGRMPSPVWRGSCGSGSALPCIYTTDGKRLP